MDLTERVGRLERAVRHLSYALAAVTFLAGALTVRAFIPRPPGDVQVRQLALIDQEGRERAILRVTDDSPQFLLYDAEGVLPRVAIFARPRGATGLALYDRVGARATLTTGHDGTASLALIADGQSSGGSMTLSPSGSVSVRAWAEAGDVTIASDEGGPRIEIIDPGSDPIVQEAPSGPPGQDPGRPTRPVSPASQALGSVAGR